jgi:general stress protein 26
VAINLIGEWQALDTALDDKVPCLLGTADRMGQAQISPKGSMMVFDASRLAYWERAGRSAVANIRANPKVVVYWRNPALKLALRFYGTAGIVQSGALRDAVWARTIPFEQEKDPERKGVAVVIDVTLVNDLSGKVLQQA